MPTSPEQENAIDEFAQDFPEGIRVLPNVGPDHDRMVVSFPDGAQVVIAPDGTILADSQRAGEVVEILANRGRRADSTRNPVEGYDPATDLLIIERPDSEFCLVPPWRCAMDALDHTLAYDATVWTLNEWAQEILGRPLRTWMLRRGATELERGEL
jgi:hypothetical protein